MTKKEYDELFDGLVKAVRWFLYLFCIFKLIRLNKFWAGLTALCFINSMGDVNQDLIEVGERMKKKSGKNLIKEESNKDNNTIQFGFCVNK